MVRVHYVKKARKDNPAVKAGEPYYWWQFYRGQKQYSATYPRRSQVTNGLWSTVYAAQESIQGAATLKELTAALVLAIDDVRDVADQYGAADDEMGGHMDSNRERCEKCEEIACDLEGLLPEEGDDIDLDDIKSMAVEGTDWERPC